MNIKFVTGYAVNDVLMTNLIYENYTLRKALQSAYDVDAENQSLISDLMKHIDKLDAELHQHKDISSEVSNNDKSRRFVVRPRKVVPDSENT